ncbi:MAG: hypothetical protein AB1467_00735 [Candidatus Diapherotrites archaeon]
MYSEKPYNFKQLSVYNLLTAGGILTNTDKEELFRVYDYIYEKGFGGMPCCKNCNGCERKKYVILYQCEDEYLAQRCGKDIFNKSIVLGGG